MGFKATLSVMLYTLSVMLYSMLLFYCYAQCRFFKFLCDYRYAECLHAECQFLNCYAECRYAECLHAECRF